METNRPSHTAHLVAMARAAHQLVDSPILFTDPIAVRIIGSQNSAAILSAPEAYRIASARRVRAFLVARSHYVELALASAVQAGVRQYVILGAGLDTFAYRNPYPEQQLTVFEVDHPATQAWKRTQLQAAGIAIPTGLRYVAINFESDRLEDGLAAAGFNRAGPAFFSWIGVSMYLPVETVWATLKSIAQITPPGSQLVFDYTVSPSLLSPAELAGFQKRAARVAAVGEPWRCTFEPERLAAELRAANFAVVEDVGASELNARYFAGRSDGLRLDGRARVVRVMINK